MRKIRILAMIVGAGAGIVFGPELAEAQFFAKLYSAITQSPRITTSSLTPAFKNTPYSFTLTATGGKPPYKWYQSISFPASLSLSLDGTISGTLTAPTKLTLRVVDTRNKSNTKTLSLGLCEVPAPLRITQSTSDGSPYNLGTIRVGVPYNFQLEATGGTICVYP